MRIALLAKFTQNTDLRYMLASTADAKLIEDSKSDLFWGTGRDMQGMNWLGVLLMELRQKLVDCDTIDSELEQLVERCKGELLLV